MLPVIGNPDHWSGSWLIWRVAMKRTVFLTDHRIPLDHTSGPSTGRNTFYNLWYCMAGPYCGIGAASWLHLEDDVNSTYTPHRGIMDQIWLSEYKYKLNTKHYISSPPSPLVSNNNTFPSVHFLEFDYPCRRHHYLPLISCHLMHHNFHWHLFPYTGILFCDLFSKSKSSSSSNPPVFLQKQCFHRCLPWVRNLLFGHHHPFQ